MKLRNKGLAVALTATLGLGAAGEVAADVYGLSSLEVDNLAINFIPAIDGAATLFTFSTNQDAILNGVADGSDGNAACNGVFQGGNNCDVGPPRVSGTVQNAPGATNGIARGENDYTKFGTTGQYSNAEAGIDSAVLLEDPTTRARQISESNIQNGTGAQANTNVASNTLLEVTFAISGDGVLNINFDAIIDVMAEVTGGDLGIAQAASSLSITLADATGTTLVAWAPDGNDTITTCGAGLTCTATDEPGLSLNGTVTSFGMANQVAGTGNYDVLVEGLEDGIYSLGIASSTLTDLTRIPVPVPGTLLLLGTGLLLGARVSRRK